MDKTLKAKITFEKAVSKAEAKKSVKITTSSSKKVAITAKTFKGSGKTYTVSVKVKAKKAGKATIKVAAKKGTGSVAWTITAKKATVAVKSVAIDNTNPIVGDTLTAAVTPANAKVSSYQWYRSTNAGNIAIAGATAATYTVKSADVGATLFCVVNDKVVSSETAAVSAAPEEVTVTLKDEDGLQSDGTGIFADGLKVSFTDNLGTPVRVVWYKDGDSIATETGNLTFRLATAGARFGAGKYSAAIVNSDGKTYVSNEIEITAKQQPAIMSGFALTDDYTTATNVLCNANDTAAVVTITLNKDYAGKFYVYDATQATYANNTSINRGALGYATTAVTSTATTETFTDARAIADGTGLKLTNLDGSVSYKIVLGTGIGVTRGKTYKVAFDQTAIATDDITGTARTDITLTDAVAAPYVTAPATISLDEVANAATVKISVKDAEGKNLDYFDLKTNGNAGLAAVNVYGNTSKSTTGATNLLLANTAGFTFAKNTLTSTGTTAAGTHSWYYATVRTTAGVFAKDSVTLTSDVVEGSKAVYASATFEADKTTPTTAKIKFTNLASDVTVYILKDDHQASGVGAGVGNLTTAMNNKNFTVATPVNYTAMKDVEKGTAEVSIENAFDEARDATNFHRFWAIVVPKTSGFYMGSEELIMTQVATSASIAPVTVSDTLGVTANGGAITITGLTALDQYGNTMTGGAGGSAFATTQSVINKNANTVENYSTAVAGGKVSYTWAANGAITINFTINNSNGLAVADYDNTDTATTTADSVTDVGDGFTFTLLGRTLELTRVLPTGGTSSWVCTVK